MNKINKTVIITGASNGIGKEMAILFAKCGFNVLINYFTSKFKARELFNELISQGYNVRIFKADVSKRNEVDSMIDYCIDEFGRIDVLINNAGIAESKLFTDITENDWDRMFDINLKGVFNSTQSALRYILPKKQGKIINISSIWGMVGASMEVHYSTSKAAIIGFTKALAKELGPSNIKVNCIAPGVINTSMLDDYSTDDINYLKEQTPLGKLGKPSDIAKLALFLAKEGGDFITGQVISPNGGFVI
ncbi:elongation factor P 5-aminopentanone reductase [Helicovermis profundi]|uniref:SDR family oxidoreductase n=1 Tax=Helicovermis profundi TaxID=3065157 RepID=A0AAU9E573_9FIRM|nr:SDR family oxidoreductase [Clostridia bacterium S502]